MHEVYLLNGNPLFILIDFTKETCAISSGRCFRHFFHLNIQFPPPNCI